MSSFGGNFLRQALALVAFINVEGEMPMAGHVEYHAVETRVVGRNYAMAQFVIHAVNMHRHALIATDVRRRNALVTIDKGNDFDVERLAVFVLCEKVVPPSL